MGARARNEYRRYDLDELIEELFPDCEVLIPPPIGSAHVTHGLVG